MKFLSKVSISSKIIILSATSAALFIGIAFGYAITNFRRELTNTTKQLLEHEVLDETEKVRISDTSIKDTIVALSGTPPIQGIIRARKADGYDALETSTLSQWENRLAAIFVAEMSATSYYDQLRYIDENGNELVRVNNENGSPVVVSEANLQNKADRPYFVDAMKVSEGNLYSSPVELNREGEPPRISEPYKPVIRYAVPIFDNTTGERRGIVIANILAIKLLSLNMPISDQYSRTYVIDPQGYYIEHPDIAMQWGGPNDLNTGNSFYSEFPDINPSTLNNDLGSFVYHSDLFVFAKVDSDTASEQWSVIRRISLTSVFANVNKIAGFSSVIGLVAYVVLLFVFMFVIRRLLAPLKKLTEVAIKVGQGDFNQTVQIKTHDEVGQLAVVFNKMSLQLKELYANLESKVKQRTQELEDEKNKTDTILKSIGEGLVATDNKGKVILVNQAFTDILGWNGSEILGKDMAEIIPIEDESNKRFSKESRPLGQVLKSGEKVSVSDKYYIKKDGAKLPVEITITPVLFNGQVSGAIEVFRDISKEKEVDKMKTEFLSLASHQLRTPLTAMKWFLEILLDKATGTLSQKQKDLAVKTQQSNQRMIELVNSLLNVSRLEQGRIMVDPVETNLNKLLDEVLTELAPQITNKKQKITKKIASDFTIKIDPKLIRQVYLNLLSNAVKYSPEQAEIMVSMNKSGKEIVFSVADQGYGIPKSEQQKIFDKFYRASNIATKDTEGNGLGLYLVKQIVEVSGGKIWFESDESKGSTFYFSLPLAGSKMKKAEKSLEG